MNYLSFLAQVVLLFIGAIAIAAGIFVALVQDRGEPDDRSVKDRDPSA